uniref:Uncharacterized protein n=1 Tax=Rhizophora mucronata TaxID=61149 RepID=A0A2P2KJK6_RHIMU
MVTATTDKLLAVKFALSSASCTTWSMTCKCASSAILGATPPYRARRSACEDTTWLRISPFPLTTAAAVSSQLVSMPRTTKSSLRPVTSIWGFKAPEISEVKERVIKELKEERGDGGGDLVGPNC